jgi:predicted nucleic acid-binding Zn ribbon protein
MNPHPTDPLRETSAAAQLADLDRRRAAIRRGYQARGPKRLDNVIAQLVQRRGYAQIRVASARESAWQTALAREGVENWAASTRVAGLKRGVFEVQVDNSLLMQELTFRKEPLLASLQDALPDDKVKQLRFTIGNLD